MARVGEGFPKGLISTGTLQAPGIGPDSSRRPVSAWAGQVPSYGRLARPERAERRSVVCRVKLPLGCWEVGGLFHFLPRVFASDTG